ncbi:hypothetical protein B0A48_05479 [Cryoendolithus antarcticus]|uniref:Extragenic suppressor of kinetochore protein 1 n=1 Tax=Cryoendolithus antarcticus TaxID=1507870 RepID=A0A1V8TIL4_9PEZI|nr:hypothetical protein B0A48_05479 [Cryoendolithus antarcticus]
MFWRFGGYASISTLDTILDKPDVTVEDLLEESDLIQELKQQNSKLVEFLRDEPILEKLLTYVTADQPPISLKREGSGDSAGKDGEEKTISTGISFFGRGKSRSRSKSISKRDGDGETEQDKQEAQRKKFAYVACEVLSSEVWSITEAVLEHRAHLKEFWQYMHRSAPLDPLQAGYFTKVNEALLDKKTEDMLTFIKSLDGIVPAMLQHVDCPMVMDLLLKIISLEKHEGGAGIVDWLQTQDLIPLLLEYLSPEHSSATQTSAGDFLKAIITISANATTQDTSVIGPNELTRQLVSEKCIKTLIDDMLRGGNALTVGVGIIIEVIRKNNSDYDLDNQVGPEPKTSDPIFLGTLLRQFAHHVPDFMHLIRSKSATKPDLKAASGGKVEPLGFDRFKTCELMAELLHCSNMGLLNERGAEEEVARRDVERERLKAEGKLATPRAPASPSHLNDVDEFGSSVDSHGFHHAEKPATNDLDEAPEEIKKLEVQNASDEDGFEKVAAPASEDLPDEVSFDDFNEKIDSPESTTGKRRSIGTPTSPRSPEMPKPLSPSKAKPQLHFDPPPTHAADSPERSGVADGMSGLDMDEDTVMTEFGEEADHVDDDGPSELEKELAKADKPAPLFVKKANLNAEAASTTSDVPTDTGDPSSTTQSVATLQGQDAAQSNDNGVMQDTEADGSPVVGDMLKLQFVDHKVVPTILDFFFRFPWNNFLHNVVYDVVQQVFNGALDRGYNRAVAIDLFRTIAPSESNPDLDTSGFKSLKDITERILDGQKASEISQKEKNMRLGYMGHLTLIAEEVTKFGNRHPPELLDECVIERTTRQEWIQYTEGTLAETRDKDNAVLGGVRPESAINRPLGIGGNNSAFGSNTANSALANAGIGSGPSAQDSLAMSEGTVGQSFEVNAGTMLSGFGDGDDDEEMEDHMIGESPFTEEEQNSPKDNKTLPPPLNIPPSRARRLLAQRLAQKKENTEHDPDAADATAIETANQLPLEPDSLATDLGPATERELQEAGLHISGLDTVAQDRAATGSSDGAQDIDDINSSDCTDGSSDDEDSLLRHSGDDDVDESGLLRRRSQKQRQRRPSTTEAKERHMLDSSDEEEEEDEEGEGMESAFDRKLVLGEGPFADPVGEGSSDGDEGGSSEEEVVEMKVRRAS